MNMHQHISSTVAVSKFNIKPHENATILGLILIVCFYMKNHQVFLLYIAVLLSK